MTDCTENRLCRKFALEWMGGGDEKKENEKIQAGNPFNLILKFQDHFFGKLKHKKTYWCKYLLISWKKILFNLVSKMCHIDNH